MTVPLVGFSKFSAEPVINYLKGQTDDNLNAYNVKLRGTIIKYKDKTWMELTEGDESVLSFAKRESTTIQNILQKGQMKVAGEIVDPKCFFGVMNPAVKKIHRSCATRCISGGIPPVLAVRENGEFVDYYFVLDKSGNPANKQILQYIDIPVEIEGNVEHVDDWKAIRLDGIDRLTLANEAGFTMCVAMN